MINIIFYGSSDFSTDSLIELYSIKDINIQYVITKKDKKIGRGGKVFENTVAIKAKELGLKVIKVSSLLKNPLQLQQIDFKTIDYAVVVSFGYILPDDIICQMENRYINLHSSLLPLYRGPAPIHYSIINGDTVTGNTIMLIESEVDAGDILAKQEIQVDKNDLIEDVYTNLANKGAKLLVNTLLEYHNNKVKPVKQDKTKATFTKMLTKEDGIITLEEKDIDIYNKFRALHRWPGINVKLQDLEKYLNIQTNIKDKKILIKLKELKYNNKLQIEKVQLPNKPAISLKDFINGYNIK